MSLIMILKWCLVLCGVVAVHSRISIVNLDSGLSACIKRILSTITESEKFTSDVSLMNIDNVVLQSLHGIKRARFVARTQSWPKHEIYNNIYVMNFNNFSDMNKGFDVVLEDPLWTPMSKFIIVMEHFDKNLTNMNQFLVFNNVYNVTILSKEKDDYTIYGFHSPIRPCNGQQRLVRVAQCSTYDGESDIFPIITIENLRGCRFKLIAHNIFPMINMDNNQPEGYEQKMVKIFSKQYDLEMELVEAHKIDRFERVVGNYSYVGMLALLRAGRADGAVGGYFLDVSALGKYSFTYPLHIDHMVRVMPRAAVYNPWLAVYHKSTAVVTISVFSLLVIFSVLAYLLALFPSRDKDPIRDFMIVFGYFLNKIIIDKMKKGVPETLIISLMLFWAFIFPYTVQAFLCSVNTHPIRGFEVKAAEDIDDNYHLVLPLKWNRKDTLMPNQICHNVLDCLSTVTNYKDRKHYTMMSYITYGTYRWMVDNGRCGTDLYIVREPVYSMLRTVFFRSGSALREHFDRFIFNYVAGGLHKKHIDDIVFMERLKCRQLGRKEYEPLNMDQVQPAFVIFIGGCCLSVICFTFEFMANKRF